MDVYEKLGLAVIIKVLAQQLGGAAVQQEQNAALLSQRASQIDALLQENKQLKERLDNAAADRSGAAAAGSGSVEGN